MPELMGCPACDHSVSEQAATCPNCGHPFREPASTGTYRDMQLAAIKHRLSWLIFLGVVIAFVLIQILDG